MGSDRSTIQDITSVRTTVAIRGGDTMSGVAMVTTLGLLASLPGLLAVPMLLGAPEAVEVDQTIVDFAMSQLSYGDCQKNNVQVENFKKQASSHTINIHFVHD